MGGRDVSGPPVGIVENNKGTTWFVAVTIPPLWTSRAAGEVKWDGSRRQLDLDTNCAILAQAANAADSSPNIWFFSARRSLRSSRWDQIGATESRNAA